MDRRGLGIIGAILAMVIAGLIVYAIIYYVPRIRSSGTLSPKEVLEHPEKYLGKAITVEGYYSHLGSIDEISPLCPTSIDTPEEAMEQYMNSLQIDLPENIRISSMVTKYKFTGVLVERGSTVVLAVSSVDGEGVRELPFEAGTSVSTGQLEANPEAYEGQEVAVIGYVEAAAWENWDGKIRSIDDGVWSAFSIYFKLAAGDKVRTGYGTVIGTVRIRTLAWRGFPEDTPVLEDATLYLD